MPEWLKGADCKSASESLRWFESISTHHFILNNLGSRKAPFFVGVEMPQPASAGTSQALYRKSSRSQAFRCRIAPLWHMR